MNPTKDGSPHPSMDGFAIWRATRRAPAASSAPYGTVRYIASSIESSFGPHGETMTDPLPPLTRDCTGLFTVHYICERCGTSLTIPPKPITGM